MRLMVIPSKLFATSFCGMLAAVSLEVKAVDSSALPTLYEVPRFEFMDQNSTKFSSDNLKGKIWVADFMFTSCKHECPMMTSAMKNVQNKVKDVKDIEFVSITTDPKTDTPAVLKKFMDAHKVDQSNWHFLTGDKKKIVEVANKGFKFPVTEKNAGHSEKFALVDQNSKIRGFYDSSSRDDMAKLESDIKKLSN